MVFRTALISMLMGACASAFATPREDALAAYRMFFENFTIDNQDKILLLFAPDALYLGSGSPEVVTSPDGIRSYFKATLDGKRGVIRARQLQHTVLVLSDSVVAISGKWQIERTLDGKMSTNGPSRNTMVLQKRGDQWLIVQFHNSPTPQPRPPAVAAAETTPR